VDVRTGGPFVGVSFVNDRFFAMGVLGSLAVSDDGIVWTERTQQDAELYAAAFGLGLYVVGGTGDLWVSTDTVTWEKIEFPCQTRAACIGGTAPDWQPGQPGTFEAKPVLFDGQTFWAGPYMSTDGRHWQPVPVEHIPAALVDGILLRFGSDGSVSGSRDGTNWSLSTSLTDVVPAGASCSNATRCFAQAGSIVLVPAH
jgi:hypothetical protein